MCKEKMMSGKRKKEHNATFFFFLKSGKRKHTPPIFLLILLTVWFLLLVDYTSFYSTVNTHTCWNKYTFLKLNLIHLLIFALNTFQTYICTSTLVDLLLAQQHKWFFSSFFHSVFTAEFILDFSFYFFHADIIRPRC